MYIRQNKNIKPTDAIKKIQNIETDGWREGACVKKKLVAGV